MKKFFFILTCSMVLACGTGEKDEKIIPRQQFVSLLIRMHLLDARISFDAALDPAKANRNYVVYEELLKQYGTDSTALSRTFDHYSNKQQELIKIYEEVQDSLVARANASIKSK